MSRVLLLLLLFTTATRAAEVLPVLEEGKLGTRIDALPFPPALQKELTSGLTNRLHLRVSLLAEREILAEHIVEMSIRYDLWDEKFLVALSVDGASTGSPTLANLAEVNAMLRALRLPKLFDATALPASRDLALRAQLLLNPIGREKMRMIRKWVAQNSTPVLDVNQGAPMSNVLFNHIFEQYEAGADVAATWRIELSSAPFQLGTLRREQR